MMTAAATRNSTSLRRLTKVSQKNVRLSCSSRCAPTNQWIASAPTKKRKADVLEPPAKRRKVDVAATKGKARYAEDDNEDDLLVRPPFVPTLEQARSGGLALSGSYIVPAHINRFLRPYQRDGVEFFAKRFSEGRGK